MRIWLLAGLVLSCGMAGAQSLVGTWQLTDEKTCFEKELAKSETEKELEKDMGGSRTSVARLIRFDKKGGGEEGVFSSGRKKAAGMNSFRYKVDGKDLLLLDIKSGIATQQFVIDTLTDSRLSIHNAIKDCEIRTFTRVK